MTAVDAPRNRLAAETSPYLLQHADNPVAWCPWDEEALARARREDKPILLSIGYSACHWCHVMAHESFEDGATADVMNRHFVNIKVDREERPDLDRIYQTAHQLLTQRPGGWPLTVILTPDQVPFVAGTYFPPAPRHGLPGFRDILQRVADFYRSHRDQVEAQNESLLDVLQRADSTSESDTGLLDDTPLRAARRGLAEAYDRTHGGFGGAPKFPHVANLQFLLRQGVRDAEARAIAVHGVRAMVEGGLFDQLGGGFFRYCVDERWEIPHFEKMLYDNGPLLEACLDTWQATGEPLFADAARRTAAWVIGEMQAPAGGYYSTLDADSGGMEGGYYLWDREEARAALTPDAYPLAATCFGLDRPSNFEGRWHLTCRISPARAAARLGLREEEAAARLEAARRQLLEAREGRPHPGRDDKVLAGWNGLMARAMAEAGRRLGEPALIASAERALAFVRGEMMREGRLLAAWKDGQARLPAYLDDHAFLLDGVLTRLQARWHGPDLAFAIQLAEALLDHFEDEAHGGFFFTADDHEALIQRPKPFADESTPAGNGVAARVLLRLGHLLGNLEYLDAAERTLRAGWRSMKAYPAGHGALLHALEEYLDPPDVIVVRGEEPALRLWRKALTPGFAPNHLAFFIPDDAGELPGLLAKRATAGAPVAYLCSGKRCLPPIRDLESLRRRLT